MLKTDEKVFENEKLHLMRKLYNMFSSEDLNEIYRYKMKNLICSREK